MSTDLRPAAQRLADLVVGVGDDQLTAPTPCPHYTVGDLLDHIGGLALAFTASARKEGPADSDPPRAGDATQLGEDWPTRIPPALLAMAEAWTEPDAWTGMTRAGGMEFPAEVVGLVALDELVVHGWDLARATGQGYEPDEASVGGARQFLSGFASPDAEAGPDVAFGPSQDAGEGAAPIDEVVALAGRDPSWAPR